MHPLAKMFGFGRKTSVAAPVSAGSVPSMRGALVRAAEITPYQAWLLYQNVGAFAKVVDMIADAVASLVPVVEEHGEVVDGHPVFNFLHQPGFNRSRRRFFKELAVQQLVTGTGYVHAIGNPVAPPLALDILKTQFVQPNPGADMWPDRYLYAEGTRAISFQRDLDTNPRDWQWIDNGSGLAEIIPVYDMDGNTRGVGLPRVSAIRTDVELRLKGIEHNAQVLDKGARLSGILSTKEALTEEQEQSLRSQVDMMMRGVGGAGALLYANGGMFEFKEMSQSMKDMDFAKLIGIVEDTIASRYNVPVTLFRTDAQTNNNYETAWNVLYDQAILPTFEVLTAPIAAMFSRRLRTRISIRHDSLTSPILARQAVARAIELHRDNLVSRNEARKMVGYEPVLGGDIIYGPMGEVPQGEDLFTGIDGGPLRAEGEQPGGTPRLAIRKPAEAEIEDEMGDDSKKAAFAILAGIVDILEGE